MHEMYEQNYLYCQLSVSLWKTVDSPHLGLDGSICCTVKPCLQPRGAAVAREICETHTDSIDAGDQGSSELLGPSRRQAFMLSTGG